MNIYPLKGYTFVVCWSMQNIQLLKGSSGCANYVCKYIAKVDVKHYVVIEIYSKVKLVIKAVFLHNTKVASSNMGENKEGMKSDGKVKRQCIFQT